MELHEALSGVTGSISLAAWVFVLVRCPSRGHASLRTRFTNFEQVPQLWENYRLQSAEGISLTFLFVWFIGDLTNLVGSVWAQLVSWIHRSINSMLRSTRCQQSLLWQYTSVLRMRFSFLNACITIMSMQERPRKNSLTNLMVSTGELRTIPPSPY